MPDQVSTPNFFTVSEVARLLEVSESTVRNLEGRGVLPAARLNGGMRLFERDAVLKLRARREKTKRIEFVEVDIRG